MLNKRASDPDVELPIKLVNNTLFGSTCFNVLPLQLSIFVGCPIRCGFIKMFFQEVVRYIPAVLATAWDTSEAHSLAVTAADGGRRWRW